MRGGLHTTPLGELAERAYGDAWVCLDCESEFPDEAAMTPMMRVSNRIGKCPFCTSVNVRTPVGRVRETMRKGTL